MRFLENEGRKMRTNRTDQRSLQVQKAAQSPSGSFSLPSRRGLITGLAALIAAPALVRASSIMPVKALPHQFLGLDLGSGDFTAYSVLVWTENGVIRAEWVTLDEPSWLLPSHQAESRGNG